MPPIMQRYLCFVYTYVWDVYMRHILETRLVKLIPSNEIRNPSSPHHHRCVKYFVGTEHISAEHKSSKMKFTCG